MKKSMKLMAMLMVITLVAGLLAFAAADEKIYTSPTFKIPRSQVDEPEVPEEEPVPEEETEPEEETIPEEETQPETTADPDAPVERQVRIYTSRKDIVTEGEIIVLTSELIGFDGVTVFYQWQVDRGDGEGWVDVDGATRPKHSFVANKETILYSWRLIVSVDE